MKAVVIHRYGAPEVLQLEEVPEPVCGPRDVLIDVHASSVNPVDYKIRKGSQRGVIRYRLPHVLGMDVSGVVSEVGPEVTRFRPGDTVWSSPTHRRAGTYAERVAIDEAAVGRKPTTLTHAQAATIPLVGLTTWQSLVEVAPVKRGDRVLVQAGSGGTGSFAVQLCKHLGAHVSATCSAGNAQLVSDLGADEVIDYRTTRWDEVLHDLDLVYDTLGGAEQRAALAAVRRGGAVVSIVGGLPGYTERYGPNLGAVAAGLALLRFRLRGLLSGKRARFVTRRPDGAQLDAIADLVDQGAIRAVVDRTFGLDQLPEAHAYSQTGRVRGKIAIVVRPEAPA